MLNIAKQAARSALRIDLVGQGERKVAHGNETVKDIFNLTGLTDIRTTA